MSVASSMPLSASWSRERLEHRLVVAVGIVVVQQAVDPVLGPCGVVPRQLGLARPGQVADHLAPHSAAAWSGVGVLCQMYGWYCSTISSGSAVGADAGADDPPRRQLGGEHRGRLRRAADHDERAPSRRWRWRRPSPPRDRRRPRCRYRPRSRPDGRTSRTAGCTGRRSPGRSRRRTRGRSRRRAATVAVVSGSRAGSAMYSTTLTASAVTPGDVAPPLSPSNGSTHGGA